MHPFLFAMASVLAKMANNLKMLTFSDVAATLLGTLGFAALVYLATGAFRRRFDAATAIVASIWVVGGLYFLDVFRPLNRFLDGGFTMVRTLPVALVILALLTVVALRLGRAQLVVHTLLNGVALVLFVLPAWQAVSYERRNAPAREAYDADRAAAEMPQIAEVGASPADGERPPDIYHFIFDRLGSDAALSQYYGLDDHISDYLEGQGFYVARDSHSNYLKTGPSIASTFYMDYLDFLAGDPRIEGDNWHPLFDMLDDHRAARFLRARGYEFLQYGSWWAGTHENPVADENHPLGFTEFNMLYLRNTMLRPLFQILPRTDFTRLLGWDNGQCQRIARQIEMIKSIGHRSRPVYVFAHILVPHGPYPFTPDGRCLTQDEQTARGDPQGYLDQVAYAGNLIRDVVGALQAPGRDRPAILIQADEGPFPDRDYSVPWQDAPADELRIKTAILNAFYFPSGDYGLLRPDITPVNSYRVLFDTVFDAGLPLLPDRILAFPNDNELYDFHDVTSVIRGDTAAKH